jgi:hypothetical protein
MSQRGGTTIEKEATTFFTFLHKRKANFFADYFVFYFIVFYFQSARAKTYPVKSYSLADGKRLPNLRPCFCVVFGKEEEETHIVKPYVHHQVHSM